MREAVTSVVGTFAFAVLLRCPYNMLPIVIFAGAISTGVYIYCEDSGVGVFGASFFAMLCIGVYSEVFARIKKTPATIILLPSSIPLLPGSSIYYAMSSLVMAKSNDFAHYAAMTAKTAVGMALGAVITVTAAEIVHSIKLWVMRSR